MEVELVMTKLHLIYFSEAALSMTKSGSNSSGWAKLFLLLSLWIEDLELLLYSKAQQA